MGQDHQNREHPGGLRRLAFCGNVAARMEHATQREFVYRHEWRIGDLVMWDNRCTLHRGRAYDDATHPRDLRRVTTKDYAAA